MCEQGDVVLIPFPYSDLTGSKQRPALIISNEEINKTEDRICCLITTNGHKEDISILKGSIEKGTLPFKSWVRPHRIFTIHKKIVRKNLCTIGNELHDKVIGKINEFLMR